MFITTVFTVTTETQHTPNKVLVHMHSLTVKFHIIIIFLYDYLLVCEISLAL